jgi:aminocarboxymuconate-semialdehyde decarboxylase
MLNSDGSLFRVVEENCWSPEVRIAECDEKNVAFQVLSTVPGTGFNYHVPARDALEVAVYLNDHIAEVVKQYPTRFIGLGTVPMQDTALAIQELRRCVRDLGMVGIQIGSHVGSKNLEDPSLAEFWAEVEALECAVFIHPWYMSTDARLKKHWFQWTLGMPHETAVAASSLIFGGVFARHPKLRVCFAHGGGAFPVLIGRLTHGFNVRPDLCQTCCHQEPSAFLNQMYLDSLVHDEDVLRLIVKKFGSDRIILGTDYPFPLGEVDHPGELIDTVYADDQLTREKMLWTNAVEFLGLNK